MSARRDPALKQLADGGAGKIAACYPRAGKWLFAAAQSPLPPVQAGQPQQQPGQPLMNQPAQVQRPTQPGYVNEWERAQQLQ